MVNNSVQVRQMLLRRLVGKGDQDIQKEITLWPPGKAVYCIPSLLLAALEELNRTSQKPFLDCRQLKYEMQYTHYCETAGIVGHLGSQRVAYDRLFRLLNYKPFIRLGPATPLVDWLKKRWMGPPIQTSFDDAATQRATLRVEKAYEAFSEMQLGFLGWLHTSPHYLQDRDELLARWLEAQAPWELLHGRNYHRQLDEYALHDQFWSPLVDQFRQYSRRWNLTGLATWDLPVPIEANLGGPVGQSHMMELDYSPHIQIPPQVKWPSKLKASDYFEIDSGIPLQPWQQILKNEGYRPFARGFVIHFYQETVLGGALGKKLYRKKQLLDEAFAMACEASKHPMMVEWERDTISKQRQAYQRLRDRPSRRVRNEAGKDN